MSQLSLSWKTFRNNVCDGLSSFQQKGEFVDMTLAADGHFVKVHQMVISLASPYLKELIKSAPCPHPVLFLNNISYQSLCSILEYIYSGETVVNKDDIGVFIQAGKALHIKGLEVMESTNVHVVGGSGSQVTVTTDKEQISNKTPRRKQAESDPIPQFQVENSTHQSYNISNQESQPNIELNTSYMDEHMEDSFQENIESDDNTKLQNKTSNLDRSPSVQYTLSNQGNIQMILNRYLYNLRYVYKNSNPPARMWRCAEYVKNRCPASVTTEDDVVVQRSGISTEDAITLLTNTISTSLDLNEHCIGVFVDLAKAFDTVSTKILLKKLEGIGIRGTPLSWFSDYLSGRCQSVRVGNVFSDTSPISFGVPQGSILGPTLFTIYINDLLNMSVLGANIICYADDTVVLFKDLTWEGVKKLTETGMSLVADWLDRNLLTLNSEKTTFLAFHKTSASAPRHLSRLALHTGESNITRNISTLGSTPNCDKKTMERSSCVKYLGLYIDEHLSFKKQVSCVSSRLRKMIYIVKSLRRAAPYDILKMVYIALCQSFLIYCIGVWGGSCKTSFIHVERAQRAVIKVMLMKPYRKAAHNHSFHDKRILKKARSGIILTAIKDAEHKGKLLKKGTDTKEIKKVAKQLDTPIKIRVSKDRSDTFSD